MRVCHLYDYQNSNPLGIKTTILLGEIGIRMPGFKEETTRMIQVSADLKAPITRQPVPAPRETLRHEICQRFGNSCMAKSARD